MSTNLHRLEGDHATIGGFKIQFPSGCTKLVHWQSAAPITPELDAAKKYAATVLDGLMREGKNDDVGRTNWASVTAAIQRIVSDWNERLRAHLYAEHAKHLDAEAAATTEQKP